MSPSAPARVDDRPASDEERRAIVHILNQYKPVVSKLLARTGTNDETFVAQIANALRQQPKLWRCEPETVLGAALRSAQLAMPPNDGNNLCWIIPYEHKRQGIFVATWQLGYGGVMELARRAEPGITFEGRIVYPNDVFDLDFGRNPPLKHRPHLARRPPKPRGGEAVAWYVKARYRDGREHIHVLDRDGVEYHRGFSKQPDGEMWSKSYDAAALKSVVLDMRRWLPASRQLAEAVAADDQVHDVRDMEQAGEITHTPIDTGADEPGPDDEADAAWTAAAREGPSDG